jgi:RNA polymerase sigma-70 factor (ECF subfamily)
LTKSDDAALFERWLTSRDGDAFAELARRHAPVVFDVAARTLGDRTAAEDVVQEALLDLALEPTNKPAVVGVPAWLVRFAICRARNQRSSERSRTRRQQVVGKRRPEETMPDDDLERKEELEHALAVAEPEERAVLAMRYLHGWEYDKIAHALETSEGAARVRVHRALANVRGRLGVGGGRGSEHEKALVHRMAGLAVIPLPAARLDSAIRVAIKAAGVVPSPTPTRAPTQQFVSRLPASVRAGLQTFGALVLLAGAAVTSFDAAPRATDAGDVASAQVVLVADAATSPSSPRDAVAAAGPSTATSSAPRPEDWDGGALARLARGDSDSTPAGGSSPVGAVPPEAPATAAAPRNVPPAAPAAPVAEAPAALPAAAPAVLHEDERPSSAFRPSARGASAANCDPGSSDGERADALGSFIRPTSDATTDRAVVLDRATSDPIVVDKPESDAPATRRRATTSTRAAAATEPPDGVLVDQAVALVRDAVAQSTPATDADATTVDAKSLRKTRATTVRALRKQYQAARNATPKAKRLSSRATARMNRLISLLVDLALSQGRARAGDLRWPDGVDPTTALKDVIGVLSSSSAAPRLPDGADEASATPSNASDTVPGDGRTPDLN